MRIARTAAPKNANIKQQSMLWWEWGRSRHKCVFFQISSSISMDALQCRLAFHHRSDLRCRRRTLGWLLAVEGSNKMIMFGHRPYRCGIFSWNLRDKQKAGTHQKRLRIMLEHRKSLCSSCLAVTGVWTYVFNASLFIPKNVNESHPFRTSDINFA